MPSLNFIPKSTLQDEKVIIKAIGLIPHKCYTFTSHFQDTKSNKYFSYAHYIADSTGVIDLSRDESCGGHYNGIFQMGLFAALQPAPGEFKYSRIFKRDVEVPSEIEIRVYEDHISPKEIYDSQHPCLVNDFHYRYYMGPGVKRIPIRKGRVRGTLFIPAGNGPFPGVIDMFGTAGGLLEYRSAQLATRGIMSLALAFFDYEDLPKTIKLFELRYFEEAVRILLSQKQLLKPHVGVIGVSKGGDLALTMATFIPQVTVAVSINGSCSVVGCPTRISKNYTIPALPSDMKRVKPLNREVVVCKYFFLKPEDFPQTLVPIHKSNAHFLFIVGKDDLDLNSEESAKIAAKNMEEAGKSDHCKVRMYEGAGHLIEPPYSPFCFASYHRAVGFVMAWGGELKAHTQAQETAWKDMINFITKHLESRKAKL